MTNPRPVISTILSTMLLTGLLVAPSFAHHNTAAVFDASKVIPLKGTVTKVDFRNPHSSIYIDVKDATGKITNWFVEMASISTLAKAGLDKDLVDLNQTYSMEVYVARDGKAQALGITLTFPDSKSYDLRDK